MRLSSAANTQGKPEAFAPGTERGQVGLPVRVEPGGSHVVCNVGGEPEGVRHKLDVLRRHCDAVQRDYDKIEKTNIVSVLLARDEAAVAAKRERLSARGPLRGLVGTHHKPLI